MTVIRSIYALLLSLIVVPACASFQEPELPANYYLILGEPTDPIARNIVERRQHLIRLNAGVGGEELRIVLDAPDDLMNMSAAIAPRFNRDLHEIYGMEEGVEDRVYLLVAEDASHQQIVFVTRVNRISESGAYGTSPGLIYVFDGPTQHVRSVGPADY